MYEIPNSVNSNLNGGVVRCVITISFIFVSIAEI